ncbi:SulP family inorganic anion transporter [Siphonobacter sp. SORGH_AS_1065]|uniref:SulP family inorganic anion transporter n=1 Tax=Siphonobacter sp. SORGH_AS_1065 TaxID=3041795 RepID=UPI00278447FC|nr:SulP family inorganic anion transporter [Siphonobacter sp. SORGH_AS_1065]MDQ1087490.1 MFS superfamily sulfate permease-like transporter [Siphonobacter sp. SORGH_AS_1065]
MKNQPSAESSLIGDIRGGVVSFLVAVPLCLGIALASGVPLFAGIIAGIVGGLVVGSFSKSALSISGPEAGLIIVVLSAMDSLGTFSTFLLATCLAGIIQILLGYARAGIISNFFPSSVIKGMLAAIGIILIFKQIPLLVGYDGDHAEAFTLFQPDGINILKQCQWAFAHINATAILIALISMGIFFIWEFILPRKQASLSKIPPALIVVATAVLINTFFQLFYPAWALKDNHLVQLPVPADFSGFLKLFTLPDFSQINNPRVYTAAISIALVASLEALLSIEATDELDPLSRKTPSNQELKAQGIGNLVSGLMGGMPLTSVIVRSSISLNAGARTKRAALIHGFMLLVCVITLPNLLNEIPWAALASILFITGYRLARIELFRSQYEAGLVRFLPFITTVGAILLTDLIAGIAIGMLMSLFFIIRETYVKAHQTYTYEMNGKESIRIRLGDYVSFLNKASISALLDQIPNGTRVEIDYTQTSYIDSDVQDILQRFETSAQARNIYLIRLDTNLEIPHFINR